MNRGIMGWKDWKGLLKMGRDTQLMRVVDLVWRGDGKILIWHRIMRGQRVCISVVVDGLEVTRGRLRPVEISIVQRMRQMGVATHGRYSLYTQDGGKTKFIITGREYYICNKTLNT